MATIAPSAVQANCTECLTRNCPLAGAANYPVQFCYSFRRANCYLCAQLDCAMHGRLDTPVSVCERFVALNAA